MRPVRPWLVRHISMRVQVGMQLSSQAGSATEEEYSTGVEQVNRFLAVVFQQIFCAKIPNFK
jgi:hypothetical protein